MASTFDQVCNALHQALGGTARQRIVADAASAGTLGDALGRMRIGLRSDVWTAASPRIDLERFIKKYDRRTRGDGFHALHDWDGIADKVNPETIPVDVLDYAVRERGREPVNQVTLAILLDYYFMHILSLVALRVWDDDGDADRNLDRTDELLALLQGPMGSGQRFAADAETLILIATSHFELAEWGYAKLLTRCRTLNRAHRLRLALGHAASMGSHLRFGFEATYARDTVKTRDDNVADYPWLCFALATLMDEYERIQSAPASPARRTLVEALLNGLSADARAFVGVRPPASLAEVETERTTFRERFMAHRANLLAEFESVGPIEGAYSPLSFFFNFSHNVVKGAVVDALFRARPWALALNDLLTGEPRDESPESSREALATTLMGYARRNPNRVRGRLMPVIVYDPNAGRQAVAIAMAKLADS